MALSGDKFSGCASVAAGLGVDGKHYLVLDGWTGISGNNLAWCCCGSTMKPADGAGLSNHQRGCTMPRCAMSQAS
ncbi:MAG: hypothetical protein ACLVJ6_09350 [Merdibacter sp.]